ncbi:asparagine synthase (glutamine-hydrolyzing) [Tunicatimonas pelagia]|uniref:asparagine synthase (glutamine-hydrolyzing) n=1 Tax=Tunicatimonas pelagia TaxID=931531 RepID=UPI0026651BD7|nr:asparagine synthase (glutamine-hydrolyzing) [Tunicatimonas pelagia]WKN41787.1 asparagine synthase (glutamine-hydrolyzing) [Tunicatimonas pelagia]
MCGIVGQIKQNGVIDPAVFQRMRDTLYHRGPDGAGTKLLGDGRVALGHRRLSIIDLSESGKQPMSNEDGTVWLTYNGEIYNYQPLRTELQNRGHRFVSHTDSEVLIHGYEEWGIQKLLSRLKGMFAFALWDDKQKQLVAARDRFGIKPFYYYADNTQFAFASEIKGIIADPTVQREINPDALADFFLYSYVPHPHSIWKNLYKLSPAHYLVYDQKSHHYQTKRYWQLSVGDRFMPEQEAVERANELIQQAVREHMVSDVPVGLFLSGGYDSATVLKHMRAEANVATFSIGFENHRKSEHRQAAGIANTFGSQHHEEIVAEEVDTFKILETLAFHYDEPYSVSAMIPYYHVSGLAARHSKVALSGDGGDEAFAGYNWHYGIHEQESQLVSAYRLKSLFRGQRQALLDYYIQFMPGVAPDIQENQALSSDVLDLIGKRGFWYYQQAYENGLDAVKTMQVLDYKTFMLEACLMRADRSSMAHSLEVRVPFIDHEIFEFTFGLQTSVYFKEGYKKYLIYKNIQQDLDTNILNMPKRGFSFKHLRTLFSHDYTDFFRKGALAETGILSESFKLNKLTNKTKLHLLVLELWYRQYGQ